MDVKDVGQLSGARKLHFLKLPSRDERNDISGERTIWDMRVHTTFNWGMPHAPSRRSREIGNRGKQLVPISTQLCIRVHFLSKWSHTSSISWASNIIWANLRAWTLWVAPLKNQSSNNSLADGKKHRDDEVLVVCIFVAPILFARFAPKISYLPRKRPAWLRSNSLKVHIFYEPALPKKLPNERSLGRVFGNEIAFCS